MPPTSGAHCLAVGCSHADPADEPTAVVRPGRRSPSRRAGRNDERRAARRANLLIRALAR